MEFLSNLLLTAASLGAALYCLVLSRRLKALASLEGGMGNAIAVLSAQVDDLARTLKAAQETATRTGGRLDDQTGRAEAAARKLELLVASLHDLPEEAAAPRPEAPRAPSAWPPSPWPAEAGRRNAESFAAPQANAEDAPRARVLRRRQAPVAS